MGAGPVSISTVATFPPGFFLENITALPDDTLLVTVANRKCIYAIPPSSNTSDKTYSCRGSTVRNGTTTGETRQPYLIHQFEDDAWAFGITTSQRNPSISYVLTTDFVAQGSCTHHLHFLDTSDVASACHLRTLMQFPSAAKGLNGLTALGDTVLLAADSFGGCIWRIDLELDSHGRPLGASAREWMRDSTFDGQLVLPDFQPGVNGLKYSKSASTLVFSSTQQHLLGTIPVNPETLEPSGPVNVILRGYPGDDLIIDDHFEGGPVAYLTTHRANSIIRVPICSVDSGHAYLAYHEVIAAATSPGDCVLGPTSGSWKWGKEGETAYFNCDGGLKNPFPGEPPGFARILKVDFSS